MMAFSLLAIVVLGFTVWAHHMFVSGMQSWIRIPMMITTAVIAVPTGIKIFSWLATLWRGVLRLDTPMLFALGFLTMFTLGGISGVMFAMIPIDIHTSDTYFVVAHIHYVLFGGSVFAVYASFYFWYPKVTGRMMNETLGKFHFALTFLGFNLAFFPMHMLGMDGMPRRISQYAANPEWAFWNKVSTFGAFVIAISIFPFLYNLWVSRKGKVAGNDPWNANSLEWWTTSPPPVHNFDSLPPIRSERPVLDVRLERQAEAALAKGAAK